MNKHPDCLKYGCQKLSLGSVDVCLDECEYSTSREMYSALIPPRAAGPLTPITAGPNASRVLLVAHTQGHSMPTTEQETATPRTDALSLKQAIGLCSSHEILLAYSKMREHACELERELSQCQADLTSRDKDARRLGEWVVRLQADLDATTARITELNEDWKQREDAANAKADYAVIQANALRQSLDAKSAIYETECKAREEVERMLTSTEDHWKAEKERADEENQARKELFGFWQEALTKVADAEVRVCAQRDLAKAAEHNFAIEHDLLVAERKAREKAELRADDQFDRANEWREESIRQRVAREEVECALAQCQAEAGRLLATQAEFTPTGEHIARLWADLAAERRAREEAEQRVAAVTTTQPGIDDM